ncbi:hypothetical protein HU200_035035 [Digitaria exilis]|uniref:Uncharacterized protein n=1 Tax=Digitaria exilis TaxID=1010633 RepID=A0A835BG07_9POAL|nr:hypothetical protein HU200_035035 [Digitaria exilis]
MAAACMATPAAAQPPLLPTPPRFAGSAASDRSVWSSKKPGRASASQSWTRDKLVARTSAAVPIPGRASLSDSWTKDKTERKEAAIVEEQRVGRAPSREESLIRAKRASSRALSEVVGRSEKKAKPEENAAANKLDGDQPSVASDGGFGMKQRLTLDPDDGRIDDGLSLDVNNGEAKWLYFYGYGIVLLEIVLGREVLDLAVDADSDEEVHKVLKKLVARFLICWIESNHQLSISLWISD